MKWIIKNWKYLRGWGKKFLLYILLVPLYWISYFFPRDKNIWVFGAWWGDRYSDNSKWLFEYVNKYHPEILAIWITRNPNVLSVLKKRGYRVYGMYSMLGIYYCLRAKIGVVCVDIRDINVGTIGGMKIIQLWHGIPLKKIHFDTHVGKLVDSFLGKLGMFFFPFMRRVAYYSDSRFIATSDHVAGIISKAFKVSSDHVMVTGYPRNDAFSVKERVLQERDDPLIIQIKKGRQIGKKFVIYLPTHREEGMGDISYLFNERMEYVDNKLSQLNCVLLVKLHYCHSRCEDVFVGKTFDNIVVLDDKEINLDIYPLLRYMDVLITDYSSVYFDYLLLNRPIIFAPFDLENYLKKDRGFYYEYELVTPGPKARNWREILFYLEEAIRFPNKYSESRKSLRDLLHKYRDSKSCERVFDGICTFVSCDG